MSIIDQLFRLTISTSSPEEVDDAINQFLPTKEQVRKKRRMHQDLWFFKDHSSVPSHTSYWTYNHHITEHRAKSTKYNAQEPVPHFPHRMVHCDAYNLRNTRSIFANSFLTFKDGLFTNGWGRGPYETLLFDHDGEKTDPIRILTDTSEFVQTKQGESNMRGFLGGGNGGDPYYTEHPQGITILNIISKAIDGVYRVDWEPSGFDNDDEGDYENDVITIYNEVGRCRVPQSSPDRSPRHRCPGSILKNYIDHEYKKWSEDPEGEFTGLIIGGRNEEDLSKIVKETIEGEEFFSIFVKPNWQDILAGYWGYQRDELVDGKIVNVPSSASRRWNTVRSQNEIDAALERGIVLEREI
jgi:hypothetical protein